MPSGAVKPPPHLGVDLRKWMHEVTLRVDLVPKKHRADVGGGPPCGQPASAPSSSTGALSTGHPDLVARATDARCLSATTPLSRAAESWSASRRHVQSVGINQPQRVQMIISCSLRSQKIGTERPHLATSEHSDRSTTSIARLPVSGITASRASLWVLTGTARYPPAGTTERASTSAGVVSINADRRRVGPRTDGLSHRSRLAQMSSGPADGRHRCMPTDCPGGPR